MKNPIAIVNKLWAEASKFVTVPQAVFILVSDPPGVGTGNLAFRHNIESKEALISALREFANKLESGEARDALSEVK